MRRNIEAASAALKQTAGLLLVLLAAPASAQDAPSRLVCEEFAARVETAFAHDPDSLQLNNLLIEAARKGCKDQATRLLQAGASRLARSREGDTPLAAAARAGRAALVETLIAGAARDETRQLDMPDARGSTPLMLAIHGGRGPIARRLIAAGAALDSVNAQGETALAEAAFAGDEETGGALLAKGARPDTVDRTGKAPICYAAARGAARLVGLMLDAGVPVDARYGADLTALMWAAGYTDLTPEEAAKATLSLLLARGAKVDLVDDRGRSALMIAAALNRVEAVRLLLAAGADRTLRDKQGKTAADLATAEELRALLK